MLKTAKLRCCIPTINFWIFCHFLFSICVQTNWKIVLPRKVQKDLDSPFFCVWANQRRSVKASLTSALQASRKSKHNCAVLFFISDNCKFYLQKRWKSCLWQNSKNIWELFPSFLAMSHFVKIGHFERRLTYPFHGFDHTCVLPLIASCWNWVDHFISVKESKRITLHDLQVQQ